MEGKKKMEEKKSLAKSETPSRGQINKIYTEKAREQEENLRKKNAQEKTK